MAVSQARFAQLCIDAFSALTDRFEFSAPEIDPVRHEVFVLYHKGNRTVSVGYEPGCPPIVELFDAAAEGEVASPGAARNGVERSHRLPDLRVEEPFSDGDPVVLEGYLRACARALEDAEHAWLAA